MLSGGLLAGVLVPLSASAAACASWADDAGDARHANLDIVSAALGTVGKDLVGAITTEGLGASSSDAGDEFRFRFTILENDVIFYVDRTTPFGRDVDVRAGFYNVTTDATGDATAEFDVESKTVRLTGALSELEAAVGAPGGGQAADRPARRDAEPDPVRVDHADHVRRGRHAGQACRRHRVHVPEGRAEAGRVAGGLAGRVGVTVREPVRERVAQPVRFGVARAVRLRLAVRVAVAGGASAAAGATVPVPSEGCVGFADEAGDGKAAVGPVPFGNRPDLDLLSVTGRTTEDTISGHLAVAELSSGPGLPFSGHRFEYEFTAAGKVIVLRASGQGVGTGLVDGSATADLSVSAVFDEVSDQVVLTVDRASLGKVLGAPVLDGAVLTKTAGRSYAQTPATTSLADTASSEDAGEASYVVGDNECFRPKLGVTAPAQVQTSDIALVNVALATSDGRIAKEQTVIGRIGTGRAVTAVTDSQGTATLRVPVTSRAGVSELVVRSSGEAELRSTIRVLVERTLLSVSRSGSGSSRTLTATLVDDDRRRLAGQKVSFSFGGRSVTATTDGNGRAVATVPVGSAVDVAFAGRPGFLSAAKVRTTA